MEQKDHGRAQAEEFFEILSGERADLEDPEDQVDESRYDRKPHEHAPFLDQRRQHEIVRGLGQISELGLGSLPVAFSEPAAGAYRDLGLNDAVINGQGVLLRIENPHDSFPLIIFEHQLPSDGAQHGKEQKGQEHPPAGQSGREEKSEPYAEKHRCGAHVRLEKSEPGRQREEEEGYEYSAPAGDRKMALAEKLGVNQDERYLREFHRLEGEGPEHDPTPGVPNDRRSEVSHGEKQDRQAVNAPDHRAVIEESPPVQARESENQADAQPCPQKLLVEKSAGNARQHREAGDQDQGNRSK